MRQETTFSFCKSFQQVRKEWICLPSMESQPKTHFRLAHLLAWIRLIRQPSCCGAVRPW